MPSYLVHFCCIWFSAARPGPVGRRHVQCQRGNPRTSL